MTFERNLDKYAELIVRVGVNIQSGQTLWINAPILHPALVRLISRKAYEAGAKHVHIEWQDEISTQIKYMHAPEEAFHEYPTWRAQALNDLAENNGAYLLIDAADPELLKDVDPARISAFSKAAGPMLIKWRESMSSYLMTWSIAAAPTPAWASKVFPNLDEDAAMAALWEAIFKATRVDQDNPVQTWHEHNATLRSKREQLNEKQFHKIHYRAPGTELTVELPKNHIWRGGSATNGTGGFDFNPNIPTEEVFISPNRLGTQGTVRSSKPLSYQGNLIDNFTITFDNGRVVDYKAEVGFESLKAMIEMDEGAHYLGEIALVPHDSPISNSNLIFFNTLFDENASNHLALGRAFPTCVEGGPAMSKDEQLAAGLNVSLIHVDFMVGSADMDIDGEHVDGRVEPIFRKGNWAF
ncbi:aminopeptidase [Paenibacillus sp. CGMCC 1.16610]|uniref:Aminopeptidase n=1 Tax=Paenibacillus anseongense TaxID=2682845 RepID=A0ABW9UCJ2_9BACL|nr:MULTISPECIES: aminopeptidase [Paenibacillus]MBA2943990.1 aminopeptidase [Paenibacillus sp. CGMCC 1.16610]MVQ37879.1 aminopeptidase [Paenibacillus anseongense]